MSPHSLAVRCYNLMDTLHIQNSVIYRKWENESPNAVDYDFLSDCPSPMHVISIRYVQHCQSMLQYREWELVHSLSF